jgi:poly-gamma-glutamate synthesis protein (capsule biosynthesis protein)
MKTSLLHGDEKKRVLDYMRSISSSASFDDEGYITKGDN